MDIDVKHAGGGVYDISAHVDVPVPVRDAYKMHFDATRFRDIRWFERVDVVSDGELIDAGQSVEVTRVDGNRIVVRRIPHINEKE